MRLPLAALWRQKVRTVTTTLGVVFGSFVLAASISIGQGVQDLIERESHRSDFLRRIQVSTTWGPAEPDKPLDQIDVAGEMSDAKRARIREAIRKDSRENGPQRTQPITRDKLNEI